MSYGYSARIININKKAEDSKLGVSLGRLCIALDIPVNSIAKEAGVSKQTVYNWFTGMCDPHPKTAERISKLINSLKQS
jgi:DNA-binding XRE family transcriptional regulator